MDKYRKLRQCLEAGAPGIALCEAPPACRAQLALVHDAAWIDRMLHGSLSAREERAIGFPWSPAMAERSLRSVGATLAACEAACSDGFSANLAGGTHHAYADRGEGFCCFNDFAVAARWVQAQGWAQRVLIVDLDVHQGNGTARIFRNDASVFTLSLHGERNFPLRKFPGSLDVGLPDDTGDDAYLAALATALDASLPRSRPDLVLYVAGADPYHHARLGRLALTKAGLLARDRMVLDTCRSAGLPVGIVCGGGYCQDLDAIVDIHAATMLLAAGGAG